MPLGEGSRKLMSLAGTWVSVPPFFTVETGAEVAVGAAVGTAVAAGALVAAEAAVAAGATVAAGALAGMGVDVADSPQATNIANITNNIPINEMRPYLLLIIRILQS